MHSHSDIALLKQRVDALVEENARLAQRTSALTETALKIVEENARYEPLLQNLTQGIVVFDEFGTITCFNHAAEKLFQRSQHELLGEPLTSILLAPEDELPSEFVAYLRDHYSSVNYSEQLPVMGLRRDGSGVPLQIALGEALTTVSPKDGETTAGARRHFLCTLRDISDEMRGRQALADQVLSLEKANVELRRLSQIKTDFLTNMSHEIRTPMTAILGYTEDLVDRDLNETERQDFVKTILQNGEHLLSILNDILDLSKIEADRLDIENIECSPFKILDEVTSLLESRLKEKRLDLKVEFATPIPVTIRSDPTRLRQILLNLVGNAAKFTREGGILVLVSFEDDAPEDAPRPLLYFCVMDTGIGISRDQIKKLFKPFSQADSSMTRKFGGTGLGLAICKKLSILLGGDIDVYSKLGQGSVFRVAIDTGDVTGISRRDEPLETERSEEPILSPKSPGTHCRVLVAEDNAINQKLIQRILEKMGAEVTLADNGKIAVRLAREALSRDEPFDIVFMDMQMPVLDGYKATTKLREAGYTLPIIALTAHAMNAEKERCLSLGCDDFATKPFDRKKLASLLEQYTRQEPVSDR